MFVAKFSATTGLPFKADKNGNFPMIGEVLAGQSKGAIINGTMFQRAGLVPNKLYACDNSVDPEYPDNVQTDIIAEVGILEYRELRSVLGAGSISVGTTTDTEEDLVSTVVGKTAKA